jgi:hypothetical protein
MMQYFIHDGHKENGPYSFEQLKQMSIKKETPVWHEGLSSWTTAGEVNDLESLFPPKIAPPPIQGKTMSTIPVGNSSSFAGTTYSKKKSPLVPFIILGVIVIGGIIGWLIYQNRSQAETLTDVERKVTDQQETQDKKEQQRIADEKQKQDEKDQKNAELTEKYMGYRNNWSKYIVATNNSYTYAEIGGISDLEVIITNETDKIIDEVTVRVEYIKTNGSVFKTETVSVTNIGPNSEKPVSAPTSERGTSVRMNIEGITAKSFHFCYPYGMEGNKNLDPYFCK